MIPMDYHMHSNMSCDSRATMGEMCEAALAKGIQEIAFTEHFDSNPYDSCSNFYRPDAFFEKLEAARRDYEPKGLRIRAGVELGEYHRWQHIIQPVLDEYRYDYVLGSLHWVGEYNVFDVNYFEQMPPERTVTDYFTELVEMVRVGGFDVVAHADVLKRTAFTVYQRFEIADWEDLVRPVWQACIDKGIGLEINSSGLRMQVGQTQPTVEALRWYRQMGGELLTIGSDSHRPDHVGFGLEAALDVARDAGFKRLCTYEGRRVARWRSI